jgi:gas vesicle protein
MMFTYAGLLERFNLEKRRTVASRVLSTGGVLIGGALLGAAAAMLLTPKSGAELRNNLKGLTHQLKEKAVDPILDRMNHHREPSTDGPRASAT